MSLNWEFVLARGSEWTPEQVRGWIEHVGARASLATCGAGAHPVLWDIQGSALSSARATVAPLLSETELRKLVNSISDEALWAAEVLSLRGQAIACTVAETCNTEALFLFERGALVRFVLDSPELDDARILDWRRDTGLERIDEDDWRNTERLSEILQAFASEGRDFHADAIADAGVDAIWYEAEPWTPTGLPIPGEATRWSAPV